MLICYVLLLVGVLQRRLDGIKQDNIKTEWAEITQYSGWQRGGRCVRFPEGTGTPLFCHHVQIVSGTHSASYLKGIRDKADGE
jgi:hypothetical protein